MYPDMDFQRLSSGAEKKRRFFGVPWNDLFSDITTDSSLRATNTPTHVP